MNENYIIRRETEADHQVVENLAREAFWNVYRPGAYEHYVIHCFREDPDFIPELSLVLEVNGLVVGHIMYTRAVIDRNDGTKVPIMTFGPLSILPSYQRQGYGKALLEYSMEEARKMGAGTLIITGDLDYYGRFGFDTALSKGVRYEFADEEDEVIDYLLLKELDEGFMDGILGMYRDPAGYMVCQKNPFGFEEFDSQFPYKEIEINDWQIF